MGFHQPTGMTNDNGVIITVGITTAGEQAAMVMPICTDTAMNAVDLATTAIVDFNAVPLLDLLLCISSDAYVRFVAAEPMVDGKVPDRDDFISTDHPGARAGNTVPPQVAGLIVFYEDPDDVVAPKKMAVGKSFVPGLSTADIVEGGVVPAVVSAMQALGNHLQQGYANSVAGLWYRVLSVPNQVNVLPPPAPHLIRPPGLGIKRTVQDVARGYTATQRRRLLPH